MALVFLMVKGNLDPAIRYTPPGSLDFSGASAVFTARNRARTVVINAGASIISANTLQYDWTAGNTDATGIFDGKFKVTYTDGKTETFPKRGNIEIIISEDNT